MSKGLDLPAFGQVIRRHLLVILLCGAAAGGAAYAMSRSQTTEYSASSSILFRDPNFSQNLFGTPGFLPTDPTREAATNLNLISLDAVAVRTAKALGGEVTAAEVSDGITVESEGESNLVSVTATNPDPELAAEIADTYGTEYIDFRRSADRAKIADARRLVEFRLGNLPEGEREGSAGASLRDQISQLATLGALQTGNAELVEKAEVPTSPSSPRPTRDAIVGGFLGILVGLGFALLRERLDRRLKDPEELEKTFGLPVLGSIPESKVLGARAGEGADNGVGDVLPFAEREAFRMLRTRLRYFNVDRDIRSVVVTSASPQDGKSTVSWNLARAAASAGSRALLLEADLHAQGVAADRGLSPLPGLSELLTHQTPLDSVIQQVAVEDRSNGAQAERTMDVIVGGASPPNPIELMESKEMASLLENLSKTYDLVVIDTPPAALLGDAIPLMRLVSGVIVVGQVSKTTRVEASHLREQLENLDVPILGVVVNRAKRRSGYGYGYYGTEAPERSLMSIGRRD